MARIKDESFILVESEEMVDQCQCCIFDQKNCVEDCEEEWYWKLITDGD